MHNIP